MRSKISAAAATFGGLTSRFKNFLKNAWQNKIYVLLDKKLRNWGVKNFSNFCKKSLDKRVKWCYNCEIRAALVVRCPSKTKLQELLYRGYIFGKNQNFKYWIEFGCPIPGLNIFLEMVYFILNIFLRKGFIFIYFP